MLIRNISTLYTVTFSVILLFTFPQYATANTSGVYIATGTTNVKVNEIVYDQSTSKDYKISHLIWKSTNAPILILGYRRRLNDYVVFNIEGRRLSSSNKAVMDDFDWLYTNTANWSHWSHHEDTQLTEATNYNLNLSLNLFRSSSSYLSILSGYKKEIWAWKSFGGTYTYSVTDFRDTSGSFEAGSPSIDYKQEYTNFYYGLKMGTLINNWIYTFQYTTSNNVDLVATDVHHARNLVFTDAFDPGEMNEYKFGVGYQLSENVTINVAYDLQTYKEARGNTTTTSSVTGETLGFCSDCAGSDNTSTTLSFGASVFF